MKLAKRCTWSACSLLVAFVAGCGGQSTAPAESAPPPPAASATIAAASAPAPATPIAASGDARSSHDGMTVSPAIQALLDAPDRAPDDKKLDEQRRPGEMLAFFGVAPGMRVAEILSAGGYTTEILARAVGPKGTVYGQNNKFILERFAEKPWAERLQKPVMKNVVRVDRELDDPLPPAAKDLDAVFLVLNYHDTVWMKTDRAKMNRAVFKALKSGGVYAVIDHSGRAGTGLTEVQTIHRIEDKVVKDEVAQAGFRLAGEGDFLRAPDDPRDWNPSPKAAGDRRGKSDRFVLKFVKP